MTENIYSKIMALRKEFSEQKITKSGHNKYQDFRYLQLEDFVPLAIDLCNKYALYSHINVGTHLQNDDYYATMVITNIENTKEKVMYQLRIPDLAKGNNVRQTIQDTGALETYARRYLYMLFLDLTASDEIDEGKNNNKPRPKNKTKTNKQQRKKAQKKEEATKDYDEQVVEPRYKPRTDANHDMQIEDPEPLRTMCNQIIQQLEKEGKEISKSNMRVKAFEAKKKERITEDIFNKLRDYINNHCPEGAK